MNINIPVDFFAIPATILFLFSIYTFPGLRQTAADIGKAIIWASVAIIAALIYLGVTRPSLFIANAKIVLESNLQIALIVGAFCKISLIALLARNGLSNDEIKIGSAWCTILDLSTFWVKGISIATQTGHFGAAFLTGMGALAVTTWVIIGVVLGFVGYEKTRVKISSMRSHSNPDGEGEVVDNFGSPSLSERIGVSGPIVATSALLLLVGLSVYYGTPNWQSYFASEASERNDGARAQATATPRPSQTPTPKPRVAGAISDEEFNRRLDEAFPANSKGADAQPMATPKITVPASGKKLCFDGSYAGTNWYYNSAGRKISAYLEDIPEAILANPCR